MRQDQAGQPAGRHRRGVLAELAADARDDPVDLAGEAVDRAALHAGHGRRADHRRRRDEVDLDSRAARANSASIEISTPGAITPPTYSPSDETDVEVVAVPKSTTTHGPP